MGMLRVSDLHLGATRQGQGEGRAMGAVPWWETVWVRELWRVRDLHPGEQQHLVPWGSISKSLGDTEQVDRVQRGASGALGPDALTRSQGRKRSCFSLPQPQKASVLSAL